MGLELAKAVVKVFADHSQLPKDFSDVQSQTGTFLDRLMGLVSGKMAMITATLGAGFTTVGTLMKAGQFEQTVIAFETMIGSAEETKRTLADLTEFAAETPFEMPEIEAAARGLIQFGERGDELMDTLNILGNAAAGTNTRFGDIALIFNQVRGVGKLLTQDFRQLSTRGILSLKDIADYYGVATDAAQEMLSKGKVSFEDLKNILKSLSEDGGRFANLMEKQSGSLLGLWSTLQDALGITARQLGEVLLPTAKDFVKVGIEIVEKGRAWIDENKEMLSSLVAIGMQFGEYALALAAAGAAIKVVNLAMKSYTAITKGAAVATAILTALQGPVGWIKLAAGIAAATASIYAIEAAMNSTAEASQEVVSGVGEVTDGVGKATSAVESLTDAVVNLDEVMKQLTFPDFGNRAADDRIKAMVEEYERLQAGAAPGREEEAAQRKQEIENFFFRFRSPAEASRVLGEATSAPAEDPEKAFAEYEAQLRSLHDIGLLTAEELERAMAKARESFDVNDPINELKKLGKEVNDLNQGFNEYQRRLNEFNRMPFVTPELSQMYQDYLEKLWKLEEQQKEKKRSDSITKSYMTDMEKTQQQLAELWEMRKKGLISEQTYERGLRKAQGELQPQSEFPGAGRFEFVDFGRAIQDAVLQRNDPARQTVEEVRQSNELLKSINGELVKNNAKPTPRAVLG